MTDLLATAKTEYSKLVRIDAKGGVVEPKQTISDLGCALERLSVLFTVTTDNLANDVAEASGLDVGALRRNAFDLFCIYRLIGEKLDEARETVGFIEEALLAPAKAQFRGSTKAEVENHPNWPGDWCGALRAYFRASDKVDATAEAVKALPQDQAVEDTTVDAATDDATKALEALLAVRAPDTDALLVKLRIVDSEGYHNSGEAWASITADVAALGGTEAK